MDQIFMAGPSITEHEIRVVEDAMRNGWYERAYTYVETFQAEFAKYHGRAYGVMTPNCTTALHLLMTALGIGAGDEVIVPECTWIATSAPANYLGATPVFVDIEPESWCLDPDALRHAIGPRTKAIVVVDLFGNMPRMAEIERIASEAGIPLIEDAAEALGSVYHGVRAGKFGVGSVFSFHRTKTLTTGEGGMLLLDDRALYERCMVLRDHGRRPGGPMYFNDEVTYKYMPFNVQAALGYAQFQRLDELVAMKRAIFHAYRERLADIEDLQLNAEPEGVFNSVWITAVVFGHSHRLTKQEAIDRLGALGVPARPFFYPLSAIPAYEGHIPHAPELNPCAYDISNRGINLPGALNLTEAQIDRVCEAIHRIVGAA